ncbi:serine/threonine protein kinase [Salpingoeca rosetta]|uniref:Serine/threonine protein kinase n=1 Tax=Salpingoeca rosetta (strain ATCC 50818 / BSB-021) TaxID=946362 RepID=F2UIB1_SALR5|nr:serine/threonine protein kinase [Salpingoeca rosetta]EGD76860.1 serine/threonine protein kinase [Salpingoeca rosetta]|eukprot:XP_004991232.1 serine/threonine protein kinase [Salpingoeca rosetta]
MPRSSSSSGDGRDGFQESTASENGAVDERAKLIIDAIASKDMRPLEATLDNMHLGEHGSQLLADALQNNTSLECLSLRNCGIGAIGACYIASALKDHPSLSQLKLCGNDIRDEGVDYLARHLKQNKRLKHLDLNNNPMTEQGAHSLLLLANARRLTTLGLARCGPDVARVLGNGLPSDITTTIHWEPLKQRIYESLRPVQRGEQSPSAADQAQRNFDEQLRDEVKRWQRKQGRPVGADHQQPEPSKKPRPPVPPKPAKQPRQPAPTPVPPRRQSPSHQDPHDNDSSNSNGNSSVHASSSAEEQKRLQERVRALEKREEELVRREQALKAKQQQLDQRARKEGELLRQLEDHTEYLLRLNIPYEQLTEKKVAKDARGNVVHVRSGDLYSAVFDGNRVALKEFRHIDRRPRWSHLLRHGSNRSIDDVIENDGDSNGSGSFCIKRDSTGAVITPDMRSLYREALILASLRHSNIVQFLGLCYEEHTKHLYFVLSWADNGSLCEYMHVKKKPLDDTHRRRILSEVAGAISFLHMHRVVHRDIKSPNVLLDSFLSAKLTDFGESTFKAKDKTDVTHAAGTPTWASPEQLLGAPAHHPGDGGSGIGTLRAVTDVFSFGCLVWEVWFGVKPWHHGKYAPHGASVAEIAGSYSRGEYLPLDESINGRMLPDHLRAVLRCCFTDSSVRIASPMVHAMLKTQYEMDKQKREDLLHGPSDAMWKFPLALRQTLSATQLTTRATVNIALLSLDNHLDQVTKLLHQAGGRTAQERDPLNPFGHRLARVAITWDEQKLAAFNSAIHRNDCRYRGHLSNMSHAFAPRYAFDPNTKHVLDDEERAVLHRVTMPGVYSMLEPHRAQRSPFLRIQRVFHGVRDLGAITGILGGDFARLQKTDPGWFGAGVYFTPDLDYALAYTQACSLTGNNSGVSDKDEPGLSNFVAGLKLAPDKLHRVVLACDVQYGNPYPVTHDSFHPAVEATAFPTPPATPTSREEQPPPWKSFGGRPLIGGHDAHVAVVNFSSGDVEHATPFLSHAEWGKGAAVSEIVVDEPQCMLVRAILVFEA